ncbi:MAG TPA: rod shape-determining protein MreC [Chitinophagales bacterium]|nr:rod shape-determining protein MreC [Chitinophagales bacterium]
MRNLLLFVIRFNYVFVFLVAEAISMVFVVRNHSYQRTGFLNSAGIITGSMLNTYFKFSEYLKLSIVNEKLMEENAFLRMRTYGVSDTMSSIDVCDDSMRVMYQFIPAKVINFTTNKATNYLTLNKGKKAGIQRDMGVITATGIAGIVNNVSENFATAMSVLHKDCRVSVKVKRFNYPGTLQWSGGNPRIAEITGIPGYLPLAVGDTIITSGFSAIFPENIPVGVISEFEVPGGGSFYSVKVRLSSDLETLQYAYVVNNLLQKEQRELEELNRD